MFTGDILAFFNTVPKRLMIIMKTTKSKNHNTGLQSKIVCGTFLHSTLTSQIYVNNERNSP
jgi:hypothetical protein